MSITIKDIRDTSAGQFFTVNLLGTEIKDCKIVEGKNGKFISGPSRKDQNGKWWPQVYFSDAHQKEIMAALLGTPKQSEPTPDQYDDEQDIPF